MKTQLDTMNNIRRRFALMLAALALLFLYTTAAHAGTMVFVVNTTDDTDGTCTAAHCSLREAIKAANSNPGLDGINFNIPNCTGGCTISPASGYQIVSPLIINGYSQPGAAENTLAVGNNATLKIEINGAATNNTFILSAISVIRGLVINRAKEYGVFITSNGDSSGIAGCFIGTTRDGLLELPNGVGGILIQDSTHNIIGGTTPEARNVISGNTLSINLGAGVFIRGAGSLLNEVRGNYIGTNKTGNAAMNNHQYGVAIDTQAHNNTIGGTTPEARNIISGNAQTGIYIYDTSMNAILGNYIGTNANGNAAVPNKYGIYVGHNASSNSIGGMESGKGNLISGNTLEGITLYGSSNATGTRIFGNLIGTKADGTSQLGNGGHGIFLTNGARDNYIGTVDAGAGNVIAFNGFAQNANGIRLYKDAGTGNYLSGNSIFGNKGLGIDLCTASDCGTVTPNDANDADTGPNGLQNFPVINSAFFDAQSGQTNIDFNYEGIPNGSYVYEFFASDSCDPSGYGEGQTPVASYGPQPDADGHAHYLLPVNAVPPGKFITMTVTEGGSNNTSEFSQCKQVTTAQPGAFSLNASSYSVNEGDGAITFTINRTGGSAGAVAVNYSASGGTATPGSDYNAGIFLATFADGETSKLVAINLNNDAQQEPDETVNLTLSNPSGGATLGAPSTALVTIHDNDTPAAPTVQFESDIFIVSEGLTATSISVVRNGDASQAATVDYATSDGTATQQGDYELVTGTLSFAAGEHTKSFLVLINQDSYIEGTETLTLTLSNATGITLGAQKTATLSILDDAQENTAVNPNDAAQAFVHQQYHDFLNREPDAGGLAYWANQITNCGPDQTCMSHKRKEISAAFFVETEFQETGYFVYLAQKAAFGIQPAYAQFVKDRSSMQDSANLPASKAAFAQSFVNRSAFLQAYPAGLTPEQFVNKLYDTAGLQPYTAERQQQIQAMTANSKTRAAVLQDVIAMPELKTREYNAAFVLMQYFGYLRRDADQGGYQFWLNILNNQLPQTTTGYHAMVCAFISSPEYQNRFSFVHTHSDIECGQ